jgi:hypothetical protein
VPSITESNPQVIEVLLLVQKRLNEAVSSGNGGRIVFPDDLPFSKGRLMDWSGPAVSYREPLASIGKTP